MIVTLLEATNQNARAVSLPPGCISYIYISYIYIIYIYIYHIIYIPYIYIPYHIYIPYISMYTMYIPYIYIPYIGMYHIYIYYPRNLVGWQLGTVWRPWYEFMWLLHSAKKNWMSATELWFDQQNQICIYSDISLGYQICIYSDISLG